MNIDAHQHFWYYSEKEYEWIGDHMGVLKKDYLPEALYSFIQNNGFEGTIAVQARQSLYETRWLLDLAAQNAFIRGVVGWVDLCDERVEEELEEFSSHAKFVGVRHVLQDEPDDRFMLRSDFLRGLQRLQKYDLAYDILIFARHLPIAGELVRRFPEQRFVLDHIAKPCIRDHILQPWQKDIIKLAGFPNVYCKVSGMVTEADWYHWTYSDFIPYLDTVFNAFGTERVMYGSDWPVCTVAGTYQQVSGIIKEYTADRDLSEDNKTALLGGNAITFYGL